MCGIAGYIQRQDDPSTINRMCDRLRHRGPDGAGQWTGARDGWHVALGHRRLSIIDLEGGQQPLANETADVWITFNGEIYNFQSLRGELEKQGHCFTTRSDTEVIVHHYEQRGADGLAELNGMFAFGIWDGTTGRLLLARDRAGVKPLYYASLPDGGIVFASELTALLEHGGVARHISVEGLTSFFFSDYAHPPRTLVDGVFKLEPGHYLIWENGRLSEPRAFWTLDRVAPHDGPLADDARLAGELWDRLREAVRRQLIADVPVGVFLSGGIDSSTMAALARDCSRETVQTFSIGFEDSDFDESSYARQVAQHLGTRHTEQTLRESSLFDALDAAIDALDEPLGDPSIVPTHLLSALAARHVKVVLGGDGGDELWAGYPTYRAHRYARAYAAVPRPIRRHVVAPAVARLRADDRYQSFEWKAKRFALRWDDEPMFRHLRWMSATDLSELPRAIPAYTALPAEWDKCRRPMFAQRLNALLALDFTTYLPGSVLTKVDRASMAHGLEVRPPFLDNEMIDWTFSLPPRLKLNGNVHKYLLKLAARQHLPAGIVDRKKKGFGIPLARWLKGPLRQRVQRVLDDSPAWDGVLDRATFHDWQQEHLEGRSDHSKPLWALLVLDNWMRRTNVSAVR